jgi:hypothetical protein
MRSCDEGLAVMGPRLLTMAAAQRSHPPPPPRTRPAEGETVIRDGLDEVGAAAAKRADAWLREGTPAPPAPPVSMAYLGYERDGQPAAWLGGGD